MRSIRKKLKSTRGETLIETLASLLIIVLAMTMLAGSIVSAARVNNRVKESDTAFDVGNAEVLAEDGSVTITHGNNSTNNISANFYKTHDENEYIYYERAAG